MAKLAAISPSCCALAAPASAQHVIYNPGWCAQFYPDANCENYGPVIPTRATATAMAGGALMPGTAIIRAASTIAIAAIERTKPGASHPRPGACSGRPLDRGLIVVGGTPATTRGGFPLHHGTAAGADLGALADHASGDPADVRDFARAKPHGVARTHVLGFRGEGQARRCREADGANGDGASEG
jgi:hypothetical protein